MRSALGRRGYRERNSGPSMMAMRLAPGTGATSCRTCSLVATGRAATTQSPLKNSQTAVPKNGGGKWPFQVSPSYGQNDTGCSGGQLSAVHVPMA